MGFAVPRNFLESFCTFLLSLECMFGANGPAAVGSSKEEEDDKREEEVLCAEEEEEEVDKRFDSCSIAKSSESENSS